MVDLIWETWVTWEIWVVFLNKVSHLTCKWAVVTVEDHNRHLFPLLQGNLKLFCWLICSRNGKTVRVKKTTITEPDGT